jgi:hypothetical protein
MSPQPRVPQVPSIWAPGRPLPQTSGPTHRAASSRDEWETTGLLCPSKRAPDGAQRNGPGRGPGTPAPNNNPALEGRMNHPAKVSGMLPVHTTHRCIPSPPFFPQPPCTTSKQKSANQLNSNNQIPNPADANIAMRYNLRAIRPVHPIPAPTNTRARNFPRRPLAKS